MSGNIKQAVCSLASGFLAAVKLTCGYAAQIELHGYCYQDYIHANGDSNLGTDGKGTWDMNFLGLEGVDDTNAKSKLCAQTSLVNAPLSPSSLFTKTF